ncbi:unnamed protein product [Cylicocyclus nassatus]|uniref:RING-type domain-containing protein n=1 Tax=Cylicocyclus nassatus TaxID=53992 RepID=A0AA36GQG2_CYLNA|nr:unnamed protein product [Cylicocyclus nassatus]
MVEEEEIRCKCVICTKVFDKTNMTALQCGHVFHEECMQRWLEHRDSPTCPSCRASINKDLIVRRLFLECDDQNNDVLMVALRETEFALSRAEAELQELKNDKKEVVDKLALELGNVASFGVQIYNQRKQLDEATDLQKELMEKLCGEQEEVKILRKKESDSVLRIRDFEEQLRILKNNEDSSRLLVKKLEEQLRISKKNEDDSKFLVKNLEEQLKISKKNENDSKLLVKNLKEQLRISKKNEDDSKLLVKNLKQQLKISKKNLNESRLLTKDSHLHIEGLGELLRISKKNENDSKLLIKNMEEQLRISKKNQNDSNLLIKDSHLHPENLEEQLRISKKNVHPIGSAGRNSGEEQLRTSKKMEEDLEACVKSVGEVLKVLDKREADLKMLTEVCNTACTKLRSVEEQLKF